MRFLLLATLLASTIVRGADLGSDLLAAARKGQTDQVRTLLAKGAAVKAKIRTGAPR